MKICGPLSWHNELIWALQKESMAQILKVALKQTLIFYHSHQKIYTWRTPDKYAAEFMHTHRHTYVCTYAHVFIQFQGNENHHYFKLFCA